MNEIFQKSEAVQQDFFQSQICMKSIFLQKFRYMQTEPSKFIKKMNNKLLTFAQDS